MERSIKRGLLWTKNEWLDYFKTINNRKLTEEEIQQAKANGEFIASEPVSENSQPQVQVSEPVTEQVTPVVASKKVTVVIASVIGADVIISLSFGGYAYIYLEGGEILEENYRYYDKDKKRWLMVWNSMRKVS